jgi:hypothetical protein
MRLDAPQNTTPAAWQLRAHDGKLDIRDAIPGAVRLTIDASGNSTFSGTVTADGGTFSDTLSATGSFNPSTNGGWTTGAIKTSGSFGGGIALVDGSAGFGIWAQSAGTQLVIGQGTAAGTLSSEFILDSNGNATFSGTVTASGGNSTNWNTAYGWGNHASAGYAISSINNNFALARLTWANKETTDVTADGEMVFDLNDQTPGASLGTYGGSHPSGWYFYSGGNTGRFWTDEHFSGTNVSNWQTAYSATNAATETNTANTIVKRNSSGDFYGRYLFGSYLNMSHSTATRNSDTVFYSSTDAYLRKNNKAGFKESLNITHIADGSGGGNYGSVHCDGGNTGGWEGFSIGGRAVFMHDNSNTTGLYNDVNNQWILQNTHNGATKIYHAGVTKGYTYGSGWRVTGNMLATSNVYAYYSDERLKDVVGKIDTPLEKIKAIDTFYYTHNDTARELGYEGSERQVGVSAQSVQAVMPEVIGRAPIDDDGEGGSVTGEDYMTVQYERLVPLLIESIKTLTATVEDLQEQINAIQ